jgi:hypothetical protein
MHTKYEHTKQQQPLGQMHLSEADNVGSATRHLLKYTCDADHVRFVYGSFDISFILKFKNIGTVHMTLIVARSRNLLQWNSINVF